MEAGRVGGTSTARAVSKSEVFVIIYIMIFILVYSDKFNADSDDDTMG